MTETNQPISTLHANTPAFTPHEAARLAATHYGFESSAKPLDSERDQNFLLTKVDGTRYVLKIANALESQKPHFGNGSFAPLNASTAQLESNSASKSLFAP